MPVQNKKRNSKNKNRVLIIQYISFAFTKLLA